jgi:outer membrane protein assembly factor BamE (lipoprotein component of BamABCDE complex)
MTSPKPSILLAAAALLPLSSCLAVSKSNTSYSGKRITDAAFESVKPGSSPDQVKSVFGEPQTVVKGLAEAETWSYVAKRQEKKETGLFLIFHNESTQEFEERVFVSFKDGAVVKVWRQAD